MISFISSGKNVSYFTFHHFSSLLYIISVACLISCLFCQDILLLSMEKIVFVLCITYSFQHSYLKTLYISIYIYINLSLSIYILHNPFHSLFIFTTIANFKKTIRSQIYYLRIPCMHLFLCKFCLPYSHCKNKNSGIT